MILRGVPGPDRLADRNDVTGHAHRIVRNRPREADILRRLRRSDGEIPDDGRSRHIHDETAALRPFAGVADIVHSADAPGILAVVLDGQNRRNIHGGDPHRHRFAALRRITDFIPLHTEEVIRSRPAEFHLVALHRNRGRRFDVGRNRHVTDIRGHLVTDEVETFALASRGRSGCPSSPWPARASRLPCSGPDCRRRSRSCCPAAASARW